MLKIILSRTFFLTRPIYFSFSVFSNRPERQFQEADQKKPYQLLLQNSIDFTPKIPTPYLLNTMRARSIARIMANNHALEHEKVLESHIECLYALTDRGDLSIDSMSVFTDLIFKLSLAINSRNQTKKQLGIRRSLMVMMKPTMMLKTSKISHSIVYIYNEYMRTLLSTFLIKSILFSKERSIEKIKQINKLNNLKKSVEQGQKIVIEQKEITADNIERYYMGRSKEIEEEYRSLNKIDYLSGVEFVLCKGYYSEDFLNLVIDNIVDKNYQFVSSLEQVILKIKNIVHLQKFKDFPSIQQNYTKIFTTLYSSLVLKYFKMLQNQQIFKTELHNDRQLIQIYLITQFLNNQHYLQAKKIYLNIVQKMLNIYLNGINTLEIKRVRGIFEVLIIMCTHEDTKEVHQILKLLEKVMALYPSSKLDRMDAHCTLAQKYGFRSQIFGEKLMNHLLQSKKKLQKNEVIIQKLHLQLREFHLASKFLTYLSIVDKMSKYDEMIAHQYTSQLFTKNVWNFVDASFGRTDYFFLTTTFGGGIFFKKKGVFNCSHFKSDRVKISRIADNLSVKQISKHLSTLTHEIQMKLESLSFEHESHWRQNHHARLASTLQLAIHQFNHLCKLDRNQQAKQFLAEFVSKTIQNPSFYNNIKQNIAYPTVFNSLMKLERFMEPQQKGTLERDIQVLKNLFVQQFIKIMDNPQPFRVEYQEGLEYVDYNKVFLSYYNDLYGIKNIGAYLSQSHQFYASKRYQRQKQTLKMDIETYYKYNKEQKIKITINYFEYPFLADLRITKNQNIIVLFRYTDDKDNFLNQIQKGLQMKAEKYWKNKGYYVVVIKSQEEIQRFINEKIKKQGNEDENKTN